jgi:deoxyxylulose-5-phosphate synthase
MDAVFLNVRKFRADFVLHINLRKGQGYHKSEKHLRHFGDNFKIKKLKKGVLFDPM